MLAVNQQALDYGGLLAKLHSLLGEYVDAAIRGAGGAEPLIAYWDGLAGSSTAARRSATTATRCGSPWAT